jgi:aerotaxis receptor
MISTDVNMALLPAAETDFGIEEMFYSRTDLRGVILAGNAVFRRVAGFDWGELIGAPHRVVRHPATPRAVFRILWSTLQKGEVAVAYVCNKTKSGQHYWVLATILPFGAEYLSVRIKPSSGLFARVQALYAEVCTAEAGGLGIDAAVERLLAGLAAAGFANYAAFMRQALAEEYTARATQIALRTEMAEVATIRNSITAVIADQEVLVKEFDGLRILPTNMRILASRLEPTGGPVGAISDIYLMISADIFAKVAAFLLGDNALCRRMAERFEMAIFQMTCSHLLTEIIARVEGEEKGTSPIDIASEGRSLAKLGTALRDTATTALAEAVALAGKIHIASTDLRRAMLSLETITVMGRVEGARIGAAGMRINATINQLHDRNVIIARNLGGIDDMARTLSSGMIQIQGGYLARQSAAP